MTIDNKTIGIALSGRGFRAALFGLGSLWRLNEVGLLGRLDRIASVSGASILSGVLAHGWSRLDFDEGCAGNFAEEVARPVQEFCSKTADIEAGLLGALTPFKTAGSYLAHFYDKDLFHHARLKEIPAALPGQAPVFDFRATNMQTGNGFSLRQELVADELLGSSREADFSLADVVAASSAFPPIFSPVILHTDPFAWEPSSRDLGLAELRKRLLLADGGIYDVLGLEALVYDVDILLVCDGGDLFEVNQRPLGDDLLQLGRIRDILIGRAHALRKRWLLGELEAGRRLGAYWGIDSKLGDFGPTKGLTTDNVNTERPKTLSTRLRNFDERDQGRLINWGYAVADSALRNRSLLTCGPAATWPVPEWHLD